MNHVAYIVQVPGRPGVYVKYDRHSPRSGECVANPLLATLFWSENDARRQVQYGDFFLPTSQRVIGEPPIVETRDAHVVRLTLIVQGQGGAWTIEDLGK